MVLVYIDGTLETLPSAKSSAGGRVMIRCAPAFWITGLEALKPRPPFRTSLVWVMQVVYIFIYLLSHSQ